MAHTYAHTHALMFLSSRGGSLRTLVLRSKWIAGVFFHIREDFTGTGT